MATFQVLRFTIAISVLAAVGAEGSLGSISDQYGNTANGTSDITWADPPEDRHPYSSDKDTDDVDPSLDVIIKMANKFVKLVTPTLLDYG